MEHFSFSTEGASLTIAIFIAGYCLGPLVWGPLSEEVHITRSYFKLLLTSIFSSGGGQFSSSLTYSIPAGRSGAPWRQTRQP